MILIKERINNLDGLCKQIFGYSKDTLEHDYMHTYDIENRRMYESTKKEREYCGIFKTNIIIGALFDRFRQ